MNPKNGNEQIMKGNLKKQWRETWKKCMLKGKSRNHMAKFLYVGVFIVQMTM
jgi:hypothetical protein